MDEGVFEFPQVFVEILAAWGEVEDGVADKLAGTMVGGLATAVDFVNRVGERGGIAERRLIAQAANGVNRQVFE